MANIANILDNILSDSGVDISTLVPSSRTLTINGTTFDLSANRSWTIATSGGTVTSVAATVPTGFAITGSPITSSGTLAIAFASGYSLPTDAKQTQWDTAYTNRITSASLPLSITANVISIAQATNASNGYLSSTDWATFNAKQTALSGTGFVKVSGTTISYDNTVYTPTSRLLTINGTAYDLSVDRSWTITPGSGMRNVQTFTATSAQTTFTITGGYTTGLVDVYVNGARLSTSDFTATNGTTVVLGVGVVANDIVDIISYTASLSSGINGSGTTGYVPKFTSSNVLGNSLIFSNTTNVGIGTATPSAVLHVIGTILSSSSVTATSFVKSGGTSAQILAADGSVITAGTNITISGGVISSSGGGSSGSGTTNYIAKWTGANSLGNSQIYDNGTNIGIGTSSPTAMGTYKILEVTNSTGGIVRYTTLGTSGGYIAGNTGGMTYDTLGASTDHIFYTQGSERMKIKNNGVVLIGTSASFSNEKMRVVGSASYWGTAIFENNQNQLDVNHGTINIVNTRTTYAIGNDASIMFSAYNSTLSMQPRASLGMKVSSDLGGELVFNTRNNSGYAERMRIKETGIINFANVPTSSAGLSSGDIYKVGGALMIV